MADYGCGSGLAQFRLTFKGAWDEEAFPKQYPKVRPPAQWSNLIGASLGLINI